MKHTKAKLKWFRVSGLDCFFTELGEVEEV